MSEFDDVNAALEARGFTRMVFDMQKMRDLMEALGSPQRSYPSIHLTGTNGKSSTARMIDSLLRAHGLHTGRYTSPFLDTIREEIGLDGEPISEVQFVEAYRAVEQVANVVDGNYQETLSYFDFTTAMAYVAFAHLPVDVAVVEVGLGGEEDSTNVLDAGIAVITPIGLDHMRFLGDTVAAIARAKAGIIHRGATVVSAFQDPSAMRPLLDRSTEMGATVIREGDEFGVVERHQEAEGQRLTLRGLGGVYDEIFLPLFGAYQAQNAAVALAAVEAFLGDRTDKQRVREGFAGADSPGRLERVPGDRAILLDGAHNPHGMAATVAALTDDFGFRQVVVVVAILGDKDAAAMLALLEPVVAHIVVTSNSSPRSLSADELAQLATGTFGADRVTVAQTIPDAIEAALAIAGASGAPSEVGVVITGSVVTVADARRLPRR